jgi:hypothetical protein
MNHRNDAATSTFFNSLLEAKLWREIAAQPGINRRMADPELERRTTAVENQCDRPTMPAHTLDHATIIQF